MGSSHYCLFLIMASFVLMIPFYAQHIRQTVYPLSCAIHGAAACCSESLSVQVKAAHEKSVQWTVFKKVRFHSVN